MFIYPNMFNIMVSIHLMVYDNYIYIYTCRYIYIYIHVKTTGYNVNQALVVTMIRMTRRKPITAME